MSIYGISRLLAARELGPAQIVPSLEAFASEIGARSVLLDSLLDALERDVAGQPELAGAVARLRPDAEVLCAEILATFTRGYKLGARDRLALEAEAPRIGARLQGMQKLIEIILAAASPQPTPLRLYDLVSGAWRPRPTFVARRVDVMLACSSPGFVGEPRILASILEAALRKAGIDPPFISLRGTDISVGIGRDAGLETIERAAVIIAPPLEAEDEVLAAVARQVGLRLSVDETGARIELFSSRPAAAIHGA